MWSIGFKGFGLIGTPGLGVTGRQHLHEDFSRKDTWRLAVERQKH